VGHGQSLGHTQVVADFFACLPLPANANEADSMEMARIAKNTFFILYFLNLKFCLLTGKTKYFPAGASNQRKKRLNDDHPGGEFFYFAEPAYCVLRNSLQQYKNYLLHKP
jgi:hypothetical protein